MAEYGIAATQQGVDVATAASYQRILDSRYPILEVAFELPVSVSLTFNNQNITTAFAVPILEHKLGFTPAFDWDDSQGFTLDGQYVIDSQHFYRIVADDTNIYVYSDIVPVVHMPLSVAVKGYLRVYNYDPTVEYRDPNSKPTAASSTVGATGIAILKDTGDITDTDYSKFSLNTKAKAINIQQSGVTEALSGFADIIHNMGYLPAYLVFSLEVIAQTVFYSDQLDQHRIISNSFSAKSFGDILKLRFTGVQSVLTGEFAYILLKDQATLNE